MLRLQATLGELYKNKKFDSIIELLEKEPRLVNNLEIANLLAVSYRKVGDYLRSRSLFERILNVSAHPGITISYAMLLSEMKEYHLACNTLQSVLNSNPNNFDAQYNLALIYKELNQNTNALKAFEKALTLNQSYQGANVGYILTLISLELVDEALKHCEKLLEENTKYHFTLLTIKADILLKMFNLNDAKFLLEQLNSVYNNIDTKLKYAQLLSLEGNVKESNNILENLLQHYPTNLVIHNLLFDNLVTSVDRNPLKYYALVSKKTNDIDFLTDYFRKLIKLDECENALILINSKLDNSVEKSRLMVLKAVALRELGRLDESLAILSQTTLTNSYSDIAKYEKAITLMCANDFTSAYALIKEELLKIPSHKLITLEYACAKKLERKSPIDLTSEIMIESEVLPAELLKKLKVLLFEIHQSKKILMMQSIRGGNQTEGNLFHLDNPELKTVKQILLGKIESYCKAKAQTSNGIINGAWSIFMESSGRHVNHVHSNGTFSACFYVSIPDDCLKEGNGWFKCGGANISKHFHDQDDYYIKPVENSLVIFPSNLSHGTNEFISLQPRITLAFDFKQNSD
ncbi:2OG-Fe(II) oxygenase family protein [Shewanella gaetbuli]|uniref:2OG-Fe(II) oxygenase n=1 Tax=Shewanella gaetbuli TaxID=220752 RepID=A0A9X1ZKZ4_9GAMM|nr:putative 2OG-Fe(II) oxygenase [Shewanella gaetbuli]MCL1143648.1 putative 2OG-Fe(II) oxygenase [Shewanella gaetbuli]